MSLRVDDRDQHRFFHTMVVMGSALALGCGGMSNTDEPERTASGGSGGAGSGGGGSGGTGGSTGGAGGTGSVILIPGGSGGQAPVEPGPFTCSPAYWVCSDYESCRGEGFRLPEGCACDTSRPDEPSDCPAGQTLACRKATETQDGRPLTRPVPFQCACVPEHDNCDAVCELVVTDSGSCSEETTASGRSVLCGCAVIVLR